MMVFIFARVSFGYHNTEYHERLKPPDYKTVQEASFGIIAYTVHANPHADWDNERGKDNG